MIKPRKHGPADEDPIALRAYVTPQAWEALQEAWHLKGGIRTDHISQALELYNHIIQAAEESGPDHGKTIEFDDILLIVARK